MKECPTCHRSDVEFAKNKKRKDGLQVQCKGCKSKTDAQHYVANKKKQFDRVKSRRKEIRQSVFDYMKTHSCVDCGESDPIVLEFDHLNSKKMNVSKMVHEGFSLENIMIEISKCEVVCSNCHARRTAKQFGWYKDLI